MCISPDALLSALILGIERDGAVPTAAELAAVMGAGCRREDIRRRLAALAAERPERPFAQTIAVLDAIAAPRDAGRRDSAAGANWSTPSGIATRPKVAP